MGYLLQLPLLNIVTKGEANPWWQWLGNPLQFEGH